jgi:predicted membrane protein
MNVRDIVRKAWQVTQVHIKKLIWYGAVPAFFSTVVSSTYLAYQYNAFKQSALFSSQEGLGLVKDIQLFWRMINTHPKLTVFLVILVILVLLGYILIPPIFRGTLIQALMRIKNYESIEGSMEIGVRRFFPMFEFALVSGVFSIITLFTESSFILRWWGESVFFILLPILLFIAAVGLIASFLFTYAEYFIVLEDHKLIKSISESVILVIANMRKTILIFILMLLISARIILNVLLILFIPMGVVLLTGYLATTYLQTVGIVILSIFALAVLLVTSYLMGLFNVFATAVWVFTYAALAEKTQPEIKDIKDVDLEENKLEGVAKDI